MNSCSILKIENSQKGVLIVFLLTLLSTIFKIYWVSQFSGPVIFFDEMKYRSNAFSVFTLSEYADSHYPPVYPITLSVAFFANDWYGAMLKINAFVSSLLIPATWFLARMAGVSKPLIAVMLVSFLPMHIVMPGFVMSENLFIPLFIITCGLAIRGVRVGLFEAVLFGVIVALTHLVKYLFLPAIPVIYAVWLWATIRNDKRKMDEIIYLTIVAVLSYLLLMFLWLVYGYASGFDWQHLLGLNISGMKSNSVSIESFVMWFFAYCSYFFLASLPLWGLVVLYLFSAKEADLLNLKYLSQFRLFVLSILMIGGYLMVAIQHSFGAVYNYPEPKYILGRYLMHLMPLMIVNAVLLVESVSKAKIYVIPIKVSFIISSVLVLLGFCSWQILFHGAIWNFPLWFSKISFNAVDLFVFDQIPVIVGAFIAAIAPFFMSRYRVVAGRPIMMLFPYASFLLVMFVFVVDGVDKSNAGRHAREIVSFIRMNGSVSNQPIYIYVDKVPVNLSTIRDGLSFWDLDLPPIAVDRIQSKILSEKTQFSERSFLLSKTAYQKPAKNI